MSKILKRYGIKNKNGHLLRLDFIVNVSNKKTYEIEFGFDGVVESDNLSYNITYFLTSKKSSTQIWTTTRLDLINKIIQNSKSIYDNLKPNNKEIPYLLREKNENKDSFFILELNIENKVLNEK